MFQVGCPITADNMKVTPLSRAAELGHVGIAQLLIKHGAKVNQQDREGRFALHWLVPCSVIDNYKFNSKFARHSVSSNSKRENSREMKC